MNSSRAVFTMTLITASGYFREVDNKLTVNDVLNRENRDNILRICLAACDRELAKIKEDRKV